MHEIILQNLDGAMNVAELHPAFVHFPVALTITGLLFYLLGYAKWPEFQRLALVLLAFAFLFHSLVYSPERRQLKLQKDSYDRAGAGKARRAWRMDPLGTRACFYRWDPFPNGIQGEPDVGGTVLFDLPLCGGVCWIYGIPWRRACP